ncbi:MULTISPECIES: M23 family metallopeptidase [unclassified Methylophaga]|jgi:murein DD-endopeptidase MepM/ murein hydrolase activator NlpD|uniref:M23 family metallopeptidase n=2 Tax=Methylophaga TaxID=40222 RepID=UPI0025E82F5A|nr:MULTISPECIES: M23 family metallopeptidase [unclassified Methylophaga]|tara:strand:- start:7371 stop:8291 length:921 start_codon:yes stop_codon:yes gene_type:complete
MQIIIISADNTGHKHWHLSRASLMLLAMFLLSMTIAITVTAMNYIEEKTALTTTEDSKFFPTAQLLSPQTAPHSISDDTTANEEIQGFYAQQLGGLQAEAIRLKMLSQRLAEIAGFELSDFDLEFSPGIGGIEKSGDWLSNAEFEESLVKLSQDFANQQDTLTALQDYLITNDNITGAIPTGRPVQDGWISSFYGYRVDPFNGKKAFHDGIDFAGKTGSAVISVADGIVSWAGMRGGYGGLVEIDHGNGYVTRYAHNKSLEVNTGDRVSKGDVIALMGSTGRSTGPHVHFEVLRDGKSVNPFNYIE